MPSMESMYGTSNPMLAGQSRNNLLWFFLTGILAGYMYLIPSQAASLPEKQEVRLWFQLWSSDASNQTHTQTLRGLCTMNVYPCLQEFGALSYFSILYCESSRTIFMLFTHFASLYSCVCLSLWHRSTRSSRFTAYSMIWATRDTQVISLSMSCQPLYLYTCIPRGHTL